MNSPEIPPPPDPNETAAAQFKMNRKTAATQQKLNMVDQYTPYGSSTYEKTGTWGGPGSTPRFKHTVTLSPDQQRNLDQQSQFDNIVNMTGIEQAGRIRELLGTPVKLGNEATESRLMELGRKRLDPMLENRRAGLESRLYNQGVRPGTEAYREAMTANTEGENDAYNQLLLHGRGLANEEILTERNQPINEITALMSQGQVSQPTFNSTPQAQMANTDKAGLIMDAYRMGPLAQFQADQAQQQAMMSGLFGLGGSVLRMGMGGWGG